MRRWFPVDPELLKLIRLNLEDGLYESEPQLLLRDLKQDLALFTWCLRSLGSGAAGTTSATGLPAGELLANSSRAELLRTLNPSSPALSSHHISQASPAQLGQLKQALISSSTAELLSRSSGLDEEQAYTAAVFRQLGLILIAWNYPHVYSRALKALQNSESLDLTLTRMLGFSPSLLGVTIARQCCLLPQVRYAAGDRAAVVDCDGRPETERICEGLSSICRVGEALARAAGPKQYPQAQSDWQFAAAEIVKALGSDGMSVLSSELQKRCAAYRSLSPEIFNIELSAEQSEGKPGLEHSRSLRPNSSLAQCSPRLRERLSAFYATIDPRSIARDSIDELTREIIPESGFPRGCIYLIEPDSMLLVPRLTVGRSLLRDFKAVKCAGPVSHFHPVAAAFGCKAPIMEENVEIAQALVTYIAALLGENQKAGVLYLEPSQRLIAEKTHTALLTFKALRQAVCDCLGLR